MKSIAKKMAVTFSFVMVCSAVSVYAEPSSLFVPIGCPVNNSCEKQQPCEMPKQDCPEKCNPAPVFDSCDELQKIKDKYCEKRACLYDKLCLTQEQRVKAKCIDDKFFDIIAPLKFCCKTESKKLEGMKCNKNCTLKQKREQKQKIKDLKAEIKDKKKQHEECFMKLLNCEQKEKYKELKKNKCNKKKKSKCGC